MLCDHCKERDAVINLTQVEHDSKVTLHLCEQCAAEKGVETGGKVLQSPMGGFITAMGKSAGSLLPATVDGTP
jgi:protein arginine kinase activator